MRYTQDELNTIKSLLGKRHSFAEIGEKIGRTAASVESKCRDLKWQSNAIRGQKSDAADGLKCCGSIRVRLTQSLHERLAKHCKRNRMSMNEFVTALIEGQVKR